MMVANGETVVAAGEVNTTLERAGAWAAELRLADIPPKTVEKIRLQIGTSITAAALSPWHLPSRAVLRACRRTGPALCFATGERLAAEEAGFVNAAFAMALDYDDYLLSGHAGHSAVLVPLAFADRIDDVVVAAAAANELMGRLSTASLIGPLNGQMSSYIHNLGAATSLGKVLGLNAQQLTAAMALALYQPNFCLTPGFWDEGAKTVTAAMPLAQGMKAAKLAAAGLSGPVDLLEHPLGFSNFFAFAKYLGMFDGLGKIWFSDTLCYKRYPGTSYISAAVEGALRASGGQPLRAADIKQVVVDTTVLSATLDSLGAGALQRTPLDANAVNFSLRLSVATALYFGDLTPQHLRPDRLVPQQKPIREIADKISVNHDWSQTVRLLTGSPVGIGMFAQLEPAQLLRAITHWRALSRTSGRAGRYGHRLRGLGPQLLGLLPKVVGAARRRVTALDFDPTSFKMYQSARTTVATRQWSKTEMIDIPIGACGRNHAQARQLVRWRCEQAFGPQTDALWQLLFRTGSRVDELYDLAAPQTELNSSNDL